jgi:hypothetical protein
MQTELKLLFTASTATVVLGSVGDVVIYGGLRLIGKTSGLAVAENLYVWGQ